jgi:hypothetical protein
MKTKSKTKTTPSASGQKIVRTHQPACGQCDLHGLANRLQTDPLSLHRALFAAGLRASPSGHYDTNKASFVWIAAQVKKSPTRTLTTNISITSLPQ